MHKRNAHHLLMNEQSGLDLLDIYYITYIKKRMNVESSLMQLNSYEYGANGFSMLHIVLSIITF